MAQPTLKSLLGKKGETTAWLQSWKEMANADISVEDNQNNILFGTLSTINHEAFSVTLDDEISGWVNGNQTLKERKI